MPAVRSAGQLEHLRTERRQHPIGRGERRHGGIESIEVPGHRVDRFLVRPRLVDVVDEGPMADPETAQEPSAVVGGELRMRGRCLLRRVHPDVEDAGGNRRRRGGGEQIGERPEDVATDVGDPQRRVTELLELSGELGRLGCVAVAEGAAPDAGAAQSLRHFLSLPGRAR